MYSLDVYANSSKYTYSITEALGAIILQLRVLDNYLLDSIILIASSQRFLTSLQKLLDSICSSHPATAISLS